MQYQICSIKYAVSNMQYKYILIINNINILLYKINEMQYAVNEICSIKYAV
jgi:hypothetical protein